MEVLDLVLSWRVSRCNHTRFCAFAEHINFLHIPFLLSLQQHVTAVLCVRTMRFTRAMQHTLQHTMVHAMNFLPSEVKIKNKKLLRSIWCGAIVHPAQDVSPSPCYIEGNPWVLLFLLNNYLHFKCTAFSGRKMA